MDWCDEVLYVDDDMELCCEGSCVYEGPPPREAGWIRVEPGVGHIHGGVYFDPDARTGLKR